MKSLPVILWLIAAPALAGASDRDWQTGTWARPAPAAARAARGPAARPQTYAIETAALRLELQDTHSPASRRTLAVTIGAAVRFVVDAETVYVLDVGDVEYALHLARTVRKPAAPRPAASYNAFGTGHSIKTVTEGGKFVALEDGSIWEIDPRGWYIAAEWQPQAGIGVRRAREENGFAYEIDNLDADEGVLAKYVPRQ
jgi:hypothetical protein